MSDYSPHTRGCSPVSSCAPGSLPLFPAPAGLFLTMVDRSGVSMAIPRACGIDLY